MAFGGLGAQRSIARRSLDLRYLQNQTASRENIMPGKFLYPISFFSLALIIILGAVSWWNHLMIWFCAAMCGALVGMIGAMLDHSKLSIKPEAWKKLTNEQLAYLALRFSMGTALGLIAAFIAQEMISEKISTSAMFPIVAFVAAYLFDMSRLKPAG